MGRQVFLVDFWVVGICSEGKATLQSIKPRGNQASLGTPHKIDTYI